MFNHAWTIICRASVINADTNAISLLDVFEGIELEATAKDGSNQKPDFGKGVNLPIHYEIVSYLYRDTADKRDAVLLHIHLQDPNGKNVGEMKQEVVFEKGMSEMRHRIQVNGLGITGFGSYSFSVYLEQAKSAKKKVTEIPLKVVEKA